MSVRILVVDDATFIRDMVKKQLREKIAGVKVVDAVDGNRAVAQLKSQAVDLILSDWEMPGMSGEELLRWVRGQEQHSQTPFVMVTSRGDRGHVVKAVEAGVSDFISKPFTPDELIKKVFKQLKKIGKAPAAASSVDILTGAKPAAPATRQAAASSADILTGGRPATKAPAAQKQNGGKAKAELRFPAGVSPCVVRDLSLQAMSGLMQRGEQMPTVFDQAVVDIQMDSGEIARVNGYVHSLQAGENRVDSSVIKIVIRFVDNDPEKFEVLSKFIART